MSGLNYLEKLTANRIVLIYFVFGALWILTTDLFITSFSSDLSTYTSLSIAKGWAYVLVTSLLLYLLIHKYAIERNRSEERLAEAKGQAELYLDLMGHDITNMNQISMGYLELAQERLKLSADDRQLISVPQEALHNSTRLIDNVRELQRAGAGGREPGAYDLEPVLRALAVEYPARRGREVAISYAGGNCRVMADEMLPDLFTAIIDSLARRSIGPLSIGIRLDTTTAEGSRYCRIVIDHKGPVCPPHVKEALSFDPRMEHERAVDRDIAMYLVRKLVSNYRGQVHLEDGIHGDALKGCRFLVLLPVAES